MQPNDDQSQAYYGQSNDQSSTYRTVPVPEAAMILGISPEAVRSRIQRGTLRKEKSADGTVYVRLAPDQSRSYDDRAADETVDQSGDQTPLAASLENQISFLQAELVTRNEELRRKDHIIAALTERIPELEASREARESPRTAPEEPSGTPPSSEVERPSWLKRFFGLE